MIPEAARTHYAEMQRLTAQAVQLGRSKGPVSQVSPLFVAAFVELQRRAAFQGATYAAMTLAEQGAYTAPVALADVAAFTGYASDGRTLDTLLGAAAAAVIAARVGPSPLAPAEALARGVKVMDRIMRTQIADAARQAAGADLAARQGVGYVRLLNRPSCERCVVLAGKFYRWNAGFLRHPNDDCVHAPVRVNSLEAAKSEGLISDPYEYFRSLSPEDQDKTFGKGNAQAIRDGADIFAVVNSKRGMTVNGNFTTEGTTRRGNASKTLKKGQRRMTPELIYSQAKSRAEALQLLEYHGYMLPGGQVPTGVLRGQVEGYGQMGAGGKRKAASAAILAARESGSRDPRNRYTMTAAERRLYDAEQNYITALTGFSPYTSPGFGNTPDPFGQRLNRVGATSRPITQVEMATAELQYRRMLATGGQSFAP